MYDFTKLSFLINAEKVYIRMGNGNQVMEYKAQLARSLIRLCN